MTATAPALEAEDVTWDLSDLLGDRSVDDLLDAADEVVGRLEAARGQVADMDGAAVKTWMEGAAELHDLQGRAFNYASLGFSADTTDPAAGALMQRVRERLTAQASRLVFFGLEWSAIDDERAAVLLDTPGLEFARHHLENVRKTRPHQLTEPEERILVEKDVTGRSAWVRLFSELVSALPVELDGGPATLEAALSRLQSPEREVRRTAAEAVTAALAPGLRTRAFILNTLLQDKAVDDRLRGYPTWISERNLDNEATDESAQALVDACRARYDIPQRWYALKARLLGLDRLADYDRSAAVTEDEMVVPFDEARDLVLDCYGSFSGEMADTARRFFDERWIDAPARPGKRGGAFCAYTVPSVHPYVLLNYTARRRDVLTLAHELGHGIHAHLARGQGPFHQATPLTVAETASVFGETVVFGRLLEQAATPDARLALLAASIEDNIATIFRQVAMNRFEDGCHTARREEGELSVERFGEIWASTQADMLGPAVEVTEGYRSWWSYIPHFVHTPGYVYAYAYGQLLALSVYRQYEVQGSDFVPRYVNMLATGGSVSPEELGRIVGCDLADAGFWDAGLQLVQERLEQAEAAAFEAGRLKD